LRPTLLGIRGFPRSFINRVCMKVHTVHFSSSPLYKRFCTVLAASIRLHSPNTPLVVHRVLDCDSEIMSKLGKGRIGHDINNALKTKYHNDIVQNTENGEMICLIDVDTIVLGDLSDIEQEGEFDLVLTVRSTLARINTGVVFVRVSERTKSWYQRWYDLVLEILQDPKRLRHLKAKYAGINQSALSVMLLKTHNLIIKHVPCEIWNCTPTCYSKFSLSTKVVHMLEQTRGAISRGHQTRGKTHKIISIWNDLERGIGIGGSRNGYSQK
jgi:hypothetical protein